MRAFIIKRVLQLFFLFWVLSALIFFLIHLIPGDPAVSLLGEGAGSEDMRRIRMELKLDQPLIAQYLEFNKNLWNGSLGQSLFSHQPVIRDILHYLPNTLWLTLASMGITLLISLPVGIWGGMKENSAIDKWITLGTALGLAIPSFLVGLLLILAFSIVIGWFPVSGDAGIRYLFLPAMTLGISLSAQTIRIIRTAVSAEMKKPYIVLARAKGLTEIQILVRHVLRNALIPIGTVIGLQFGALLTGAIVTESVFSWQGIGVLLLTSIHRRDYPMMQGLILLIAMVYLTVNFLVDVSYLLIDPRIRRHHETHG
jgi:ABC-type dipeptide/oligopeptide/nickel transport system permease component